MIMQHAWDLLKFLALPVFHIPTGFNKETKFNSHGKGTACITWNSFPGLTKALLDVEQEHVPKCTIVPLAVETCIEFVCCGYEK